MKIYQWFIPNKKNKFHPVALRPLGLVIFLICFALIPLAYNISSARQFRVLGYATNISVADLNSLSNQERINAGLQPLTLNSALNSAAQAKANDMFTDNYWAHVAPDGTTPWSFILASGYNYTAAGENLAKDFNFSSGVVSGWMGSPTHKANVLNNTYTDVGYAVINGILSGSETTLVVAMYGAKEEPVIASTEPTTTTTNNSQPATVAQNTTSSAPTTTEQTTVTSEPVTTNSTTTPDQPTPNNETITAPASITETADNGVVAGIESLMPIKAYNSFNWGQKASLLLASTMILLFIMKHTLVWREQKRGARHIWLRAHPLGQVAVLAVAIIITLANGVGVVL